MSNFKIRCSFKIRCDNSTLFKIRCSNKSLFKIRCSKRYFKIRCPAAKPGARPRRGLCDVYAMLFGIYAFYLLYIVVSVSISLASYTAK